jgi:hypothetical protein
LVLVYIFYIDGLYGVTRSDNFTKCLGYILTYVYSGMSAATKKGS